ncbi:GAF domain-containing protein [Scytonema millei VB511283]|uniref:histidine kinase n=2 Tax=Scytonema TaxID=1203 RepID=A0A9X5E5E6_9CYAN|nr:GAF domain-containing protein [Scytonema millei VB511283]
MLLVLEEPELKVLQVSSNINTYLGLQPQDLLGQPLSYLIDPQQAIAIAQQLTGENTRNPLKLSISTDRGKRYFDAIAYRTADEAIVELEPIDSPHETSFFSFHAAIAGIMSQIQSTSSLPEFLQLVAEEVRKLTGFDRVMVYQFDPTGAGCVVAETKRADLSPYLGLHYPATDIPQPARELYARCWLRFIPNISAPSVDLVTLNQQPVDLSLSILRSVDACCVEYHRNMGVAALLVIALMQEQQLWGLIACHHYTPKYLTSEVRIACKFLGQLASLELANKIRQQELSDRVKLKSLQSELIESISQASNIVEALIQPAPRLLSLTNATGAAVCLGNEISLVGATPSLEEVRSLIDWADTQVSDNLFATDFLPQIYPPSVEFKATASGLLLLRISKIRCYYILWFRPEVIQTVTWAGDPNSSFQLENGSIRLSPRHSFERWQETVKLKSLPWQSYELDSANDLKTAIVGVVLRKAEELAQINQELERSNRELAAFAYAASHDLKEPLRGIYNYSTILLEDYAALLDLDGVDCLQTIKSLSQRMETLIDALLRLSLLGKAQLNLQATNLNELLQQAIAVLFASRPDAQMSIRIPRCLPTIECDPVLVSEVFSNLMSNALKYNDKADPWVEIGDWERSGEPTIFYVRDNGIGIQAHHHETIFKLFKRLHSQEKYGGGTGAGLAIVKKIVELHGGKIWVESVPGAGATFYFSLQ